MHYFYFALALAFATCFAKGSDCDSCSSVMKQYSACTAKEEQNFDNLEAKVKGLEKHVEALKAKDYGCQSGSGTSPRYGTVPHTRNMVYIITHKFKPEFKEKPAFAYGLHYLDIYKRYNARVETKLISLTNTGFKLKISSWSKTILYRAGATWIACPKA